MNNPHDEMIAAAFVAPYKHDYTRCQPCVTTFGRDNALPAAVSYTGPLGSTRLVCWDHYIRRHPDPMNPAPDFKEL